jgi:heme/copper-type cytochrome/quinol oxidase subunit 4
VSGDAVRGSRWQLTVAIAVSLALEIVGFLLVTNSTGDMRTFGWFIVVLGAIFTGVNLAMRRMR